MSRTRGSGRSKASLVPALDDHVRGGADADRDPAGAAAARLAAHWARVAGPRVNTGAMAVPSRRPAPIRWPGPAGERVGAVHLRGPGAGVAEVGQLGHQVPLVGQGDAVEGDGDAVALHADISSEGIAGFVRQGNRVQQKGCRRQVIR